MGEVVLHVIQSVEHSVVCVVRCCDVLSALTRVSGGGGFGLAEPLNVTHHGKGAGAFVSKLLWCDAFLDSQQVFGCLHCSLCAFCNSIDQRAECPAIPPVLGEVLDVVLGDLAADPGQQAAAAR